MVLGRRELSAILLAAAAIVFYLVLLSAAPSGAQTDGDTTNGDQITDEIEADLDIEDDVTIEEDVDIEEDEPPPPRKKPRTQEIINIPDKPLPPTGGLPVYATVAGSVLTGAGLLALGFAIRRGARR